MNTETSPLDHHARLIARAEAAREAAVQQARQHAQEARTQRGIVIGILRELGLPEEDWNAERHVLEAFDKLQAELAELGDKHRTLEAKLRARPLELGEAVCTWITPDRPLVARVARLYHESDTVGLVGIGTDGSRWVTRSGACVRVHRPEDQADVVVPTWRDDELVAELEATRRERDALQDDVLDVDAACTKSGVDPEGTPAERVGKVAAFERERIARLIERDHHPGSYPYTMAKRVRDNDIPGGTDV